MLPIVLVVLASRRRLPVGVGYRRRGGSRRSCSSSSRPAPGTETWDGPADRQSRSPRIAVARGAAGLRVSDRLVLPVVGDRSARARDDRSRHRLVRRCSRRRSLMQIYRLLTRRYCLASHLLFVSVGVDAAGGMGAAQRARRALSAAARRAARAARRRRARRSRRSTARARRARRCADTLSCCCSDRCRCASSGSSTTCGRIPPNRWTEAQTAAAGVRLPEGQGREPRVLDERHAGLAARVLQRREGDAPAGPTRSVAYPRLRQGGRSRAGDGETVAVVGYTHTSGAPGCWDVPICTGGTRTHGRRIPSRSSRSTTSTSSTSAPTESCSRRWVFDSGDSSSPRIECRS